MKFIINSQGVNQLNLMRGLGYHPHGGGQSFARRLARTEFPRFHVYLKELGGNLEIALHLDQKGACYEQQTAHSGNYDGELIVAEKERIINLLQQP
jgi:hypothetical protein